LDGTSADKPWHTCNIWKAAGIEDTKEQYNTFYIAVACLVIVIELIGGCYIISIADQGDLGCQHFYLVGVAGIRSFDMMSDWAFFALSLAFNSEFHQKYDGDYFQIRDASFIFNIIGLLVWIPDMVGFKYRVADAKESGHQDDFWRTYPQKITMFVFLFEDIPQIVITCIYFGTMGFDDAGGIAVFAFIMSLLSLLLNGQVFVQEMIKHPDSFSEKSPSIAPPPFYNAKTSRKFIFRVPRARAAREHELAATIKLC